MILFSWLFVIPSWTTKNAAQNYFPIGIWIQGYENFFSECIRRHGRQRPVPDRLIYLRKCDIPTANRYSFFQILWVCLSNEKTE